MNFERGVEMYTRGGVTRKVEGGVAGNFVAIRNRRERGKGERGCSRSGGEGVLSGLAFRSLGSGRKGICSVNSSC